jgi:hypothetical protein
MPPAPTTRRLRLSPEFGCWPTWDQDTGESLDPADLRLPADLAERLRRWDDAFQATFDSAYPPDSRFPHTEAEAAWYAEGRALFVALCEVFGSDLVTCIDGLRAQP